MRPTRVRLRGRRNRLRRAPSVGVLPTTACHAPAVQMFLGPDGSVRPCCRQLTNYGNVAETSLLDIWRGAVRRDLVDRLARFDYSAGCENCEAEIATEGREDSYAEFFVERAGHLAEGPAAAEWPRWIDFNISTSCNLQCIQCSGELSSSIRIHREKRPPLPNPYGEEFFSDLRSFIPHLDGAIFAGGEPFLGAENYRVWDMIAELRPDLDCRITTNATQWTPRVRDVVERLRVSFMFSIDGFSASTFESIRVGADRDEVYSNVDRMCEVARRRGTGTSISHCLMPQNYHEFGDLLLWADERGLPVHVSVVRSPAHASIARLPADRLRELHAELMARDDEMMSRLGMNTVTWRNEVDRIGSWVDSADRHPGEEWAKWGRTVLLFRCNGDGPHDDARALEELRAFAGGVVHRVDVGVDDIVFDCDEALPGALGVDRSELVGQNFESLEAVSLANLGPKERFEVIASGDDRMDATLVYGTTEVRLSMVAMRDFQGTARSGRILLAMRPL